MPYSLKSLYFVILLPWPVLGQIEGCRADPLRSVLPVFISSGTSRLEALIRLAYEERVCLALEVPREVDLSQPVSVSMRNELMRRGIELILEGLPRPVMSEQQGVVSIRFAHDPAALKWLDTRIGTFSARRASLRSVNNLLRMTFILERDPSVQGFAGTYNPGDLGDAVGPFEESTKSVRELLNVLIRASIRGGIWMAVGWPSEEWILAGYSEGLGNFLGRFRAVLREPARIP